MSSVAQKAAPKKRPSQNSQSSFFKKRAQAKLTVGKPNDKYEAQADRAADQVVANKSVASNGTFFSPSTVIQKSGENEELQQKPVVEKITPGIQLKAEENIQQRSDEEIQEKAEEEIQEKQNEKIQSKTDEEVQEQTESKTDEEVQSQLDDTKSEEAQLKPETAGTPPIQLVAEEEIQEQTDVDVQEKTEDVQLKLDDDAQTKPEDVQTKPEPPSLEPIQPKEQVAQPKVEIPVPAPIVQIKPDEEIQEKQDEEIQEQAEEEKEVQMKGTPEGPPSSTTNFESHLQSSKGGGSPLPDGTRREMESSFGADFSNVRIHTDSRAIGMNQALGAQAFATGNNVYFNEGKFDPRSMGGRHLLAHELTHTIQQGSSPQAGTIQASELLQAFSVGDLFPWMISGARNIPGYIMFTVVAGYDPLLGENVERTPENLLHGLLSMAPFGNVIYAKLVEFGIIDQVFEWVSGKLGELGLSAQSILDLMGEAWDELSFPFTDLLSVAAEKFMTVMTRVTSFASGLIEQIMTWVKEALINFAEPYLAENRAWALIKKIIRYDPLRDEEVNAPTVEILEDFLLLIGKETELEQMREKGTLQETADWLDTQYGSFTSLLQELRSVISNVWEAVQPGNLANIGVSITAMAGQVGALLQRVWDFALEVAAKVLDLVKDSLLTYLSEQALGIRGYSLLRVIIGKDPFTNEVIERNVPNLIRGFMSLMSGGEEQYAQMEETGAIARIVGQIDAAVETLNMTPAGIVQMFVDLWNTFTINDLLNPIDAFMRIIDAFGDQMGRLVTFVAEIIRIVIVAVLEIMNFPFDLIGNIITRSMEAIEDIKNDPIGFLKNILRAIKQGFIQFFENILTHLVGGITGWLMSELEDANVPVLTDFSLQGVIAWVLEVLNVSMDAIWEKLAAHPRIGPERVAQMRGAIDTLEGIWTFIMDVRERGIIAIWEKIQEQLSNLWGAVLSAIQGYIMERIITQVTVKLMGMLDPTGIMAVVNSCIAFYAAVQSFIKYLREMLEIVNSFVNGVADVARGNVATAANYLESTMGDSMPIVIGFLANQVGLGGIGARIGSIIESVRQMVDEALTWLVNMAVDTGLNLLDNAMGALGISNTTDEPENTDANGNLSDTEVGETVQFSVEGESHRIWISVVGSVVEVMVASIPTTVRQKITFFEENKGTLSSPEIQAEAQGHINALEASYVRAKALATQTVAEFEDARVNPSPENNQEAETKDEATEAAENDIKRSISELFRIYGGESSVIQRFSAEIEALHSQAREQVIEEILRNQSAYESKTSWEQMQDALKLADPIGRPLRRQYTFGEHVFTNQAIPAMDQAVAQYISEDNLFTDAKLRPATTRAEYIENRIPTIHGGARAAAAVKAALQTEAFGGDVSAATVALTNYFKASFEGNSEHGLYSPIIRSTDIAGGMFVMNYDYGEDAEREGGKRDFQVNMEIFDLDARQVRQTVSGNNLTLKESGTRGRTNSAGSITVPGFSHLRLNSAHVIADWFQGSGYNRALNLIVTSADYNQNTMFNAEERIAQGIEEETRHAKVMDESNIITADVVVDVVWQAHSNDGILAALQLLQEPREMNTEELRELIDSTRTKLQALQFPRKCEAITYVATIKLNGEPSGVVLRENIDEDTGL